jgi:hypothetical protein
MGTPTEDIRHWKVSVYVAHGSLILVCRIMVAALMPRGFVWSGLVDVAIIKGIVGFQALARSIDGVIMPRCPASHMEVGLGQILSRARSCGIVVPRIAEKSLSNPCQGPMSRQAYNISCFTAPAPWLFLGVEVSFLVDPQSKHVPRFDHAKSIRGASNNIALWASHRPHFQHVTRSAPLYLARLTLWA